jgi:uncharacterized protein (UPF0261 family)
MLNPLHGWSEADREGGPLYDRSMNNFFIQCLKAKLDSKIEIRDVDHHINDVEFGEIAAEVINVMVKKHSKRIKRGNL